MPDSGAPALRLRGVSRQYHDGTAELQVLDRVDLDVRAGQSLAVTGASGSGKSTLLHLAGGMDLPDAGEVEVLGQAINRLAEPERTRFRARHIGLVFQDYNLIESLSAYENIELAAWLTGVSAARAEVQRLAEELGIGALLDRRPDQLSGGQQQRVAICRALIHRPALVLADEPTGSLDQASAAQVMQVLAASVAARGSALVLVTHSAEIAAACDRQLQVRGGKLVAVDS
jgi:putative ABC transport system ATP-binding protein